jgi:hypothetical protein
MAATLTNPDFTVVGDKRLTTVNVTADTSYPTGGYSITPAQLGLGAILTVDCAYASSSTPAIRAVRYNNSTSKLLFFDQAFAEIAAGVDLSTFSGQIQAMGW